MQTIEWKPKPLGSMLADTVIASFSRSFGPHCPESHKLLQEKPIEIIADFAGWHLGWRRYACTNCHGVGSRLVLSGNTDNSQYQTHPVC